MLNYRNLNILFFIALLAIIITSNYCEVGILAYILLISIYLLIIIIGTFSIQLNFYFTSLNSGSRSSKEIAITFDDGPHPKVTPEVLRLLDEHQMKATFFCIGKNVNNHSNIAPAWDTGAYLSRHQRWPPDYWPTASSRGQDN